MNDQTPPQIMPQPQLDPQELLAQVDELQAQNNSLLQRCVLLNREVRFRDQRIQQLEQEAAQKAGFMEEPEEGSAAS